VLLLCALGALYGVLSIGTCIGETTMGFVFSAFVKSPDDHSTLPYYPGAVMFYALPFSLASALLVLATPSEISPTERAEHEVRAKEEEQSMMDEIRAIQEQEELTIAAEARAADLTRRRGAKINNGLNKPLLEPSISMSVSNSFASSAQPSQYSEPVNGGMLVDTFSYDLSHDESDESAASVVMAFAQNS
jgi:hypothetical protein